MLIQRKVGFIKLSNSHPVVGRAAATLRTDPVDVLTVVLDVAGLAVDAVGGVDDELHVSCIIWLVLVHPGRTEPERRDSSIINPEKDLLPLPHLPSGPANLAQLTFSGTSSLSSVR